ncbi:hypothetical protein ACP4OV_031076 [Aristida adscensionis]
MSPVDVAQAREKTRLPLPSSPPSPYPIGSDLIPTRALARAALLLTEASPPGGCKVSVICEEVPRARRVHGQEAGLLLDAAGGGGARALAGVRAAEGGGGSGRGDDARGRRRRGAGAAHGGLRSGGRLRLRRRRRRRRAGAAGGVGPVGARPAAACARAPSAAGATVEAGSAARRNDLRLLLGVMGALLAPVHVCAAEPLPHLSIKGSGCARASARVGIRSDPTG